MIAKKKYLPTDISTFSAMINGNYIYIDKTKYIYDLFSGGSRYYFLFRPRRFGKSLLISTLKEMFLGNKELFKDLWIYNSDYAWRPYPVIHLDFGAIGHITTDELIFNFAARLDSIAESYGHDIKALPNVSAKLVFLVENLSKQHGPNSVVVLIDEYDKPILDHVNDTPVADEQREQLKSFYDALKGLDAYLRAIFITGVTKFSKTSVFSGLNNLQDISLNPSGSVVLGYTDEEIDSCFHYYIADIAQKKSISEHVVREEMRKWYNGYTFCGDDDIKKVYNPFSVLYYLQLQKIKNYWFESGTPTFLIKLLKKYYEKHEMMANFDAVIVSGSALGAFEITQNFPLNTLLFQTGYLTIKDYDEKYDMYTLTIPNEEVRVSISGYLMGIAIHQEKGYVDSAIFAIRNALIAGDVPAFCSKLSHLLAGIPYHILVKNEAYYHSLVHLLINLLGYEIQSEVATSQGRIDLTLILKKTIYLFEFKFNSTGKEALQQIHERKYYEKYLSNNKDIILVGISFNHSKKKLVLDWVFEKIISGSGF